MSVQLREGTDALIGERQFFGDESLHLGRRIAREVARAVLAPIGFETDRDVVFEATTKGANQLVAAIQTITVVFDGNASGGVHVHPDEATRDVAAPQDRGSPRPLRVQRI